MASGMQILENFQHSMQSGSDVWKDLIADDIRFEGPIDQAKKMLIDSDPNAEGFYQHMGAVRIGEVSSKPEGRTLPQLVYELRK